jgi:outer membrane receptor protein involved in Fe transport
VELVKDILRKEKNFFVLVYVWEKLIRTMKILLTGKFSLIALVFSATFCYAGTTGKITGTIKSTSDGLAIAGANVMLVDTEFGSSTDINGKYLIINVPPGSYSLRTQFIGYKTVTVENVLVSSDVTSRVNFDLEETVIEGEEVVVVAKRPLIRLDATSKLKIVTNEEMEAMPIEDFSEILGVQAGFVKDASGQFHVRGGRGNELAFMIDGVYISDPLYSTYSNLLLDKSNVQELQVMSGTFNAEYGRAMSGMVNIVTKDPDPELDWSFEVLSPQFNSSPYRKANALTEDTNPDGKIYSPWGVADEYDSWDRKNLLGQFRGNISGGIPFSKKATFFLSSRYLNENSYLPFGYSVQRELMGKINYNITPSIKFSLLSQRTLNESKPYSHSWKYSPESMNRFDRTNSLDNLLFKHVLSDRSFYSLRFSRTAQTFDRYVPGKEVTIGDDLKPVESTYEIPVSWNGEFVYRGDDSVIQNEQTETIGLKFDITSQFSSNQEIKAGFDLINHSLKRFRYLNPYLATGILHDYQDYEKFPKEAAAYFQNKIEADFVIMNLGLRVDYFDANDNIWRNIYQPGYVDSEGFHYYPEEKVDPKIQISPRIGLAHPITDRMVLHFAYGHFFQRPDYTDMYYLHDIRQLLLNPAGNPRVHAQKTVSYEVGFKREINVNTAFDLSVYYKDIFNLSGTSEQLFYPYTYPIVDNSNYAFTRGIELSFEKRFGNYWGGTLNYTLSEARTRENQTNPWRALYGATEIRPRREYPANWDQAHKFGINLNIGFPENFGFQLFSLRPLQNFGMSFLISLGSGFPYSPQLGIAEEQWRTALLINSARRSWTHRIDLRAEKKLQTFLGNFTLYSKITNLLDTRNALFVYPITGEPWDAGPFYRGSEEYLKNPTVFDAPRQIHVGIKIAN